MFVKSKVLEIVYIIFGCYICELKCSPGENNVCRHVSPGDSGAGLPYAPEGWPEPGDIWGWKVGRRINNSGFYQDRYLYLPEYLHKPSCPKKFQSKLECKRYLQKTFPNIDLGRFFDSFKWKIPSKELTPTKG